jgi:hypothetical protein
MAEDERSRRDFLLDEERVTAPGEVTSDRTTLQDKDDRTHDNPFPLPDLPHCTMTRASVMQRANGLIYMLGRM